MGAAKPPPLGAAPAHLFADAAKTPGPGDRLVVFTPDGLRAALHNAVVRGQLEDVQLCVERGALSGSERGGVKCLFVFILP